MKEIKKRKLDIEGNEKLLNSYALLHNPTNATGATIKKKNFS